MHKKRSRYRYRHGEGLINKDSCELMPGAEMDFFYKQCRMLRVPRCIKEIMKEKQDILEKPQDNLMRFIDIDFSDEEFPQMSLEEFKQNVIGILHVIRKKQEELGQEG